MRRRVRLAALTLAALAIIAALGLSMLSASGALSAYPRGRWVVIDSSTSPGGDVVARVESLEGSLRSRTRVVVRCGDDESVVLSFRGARRFELSWDAGWKLIISNYEWDHVQDSSWFPIKKDNCTIHDRDIRVEYR